jgi:hypothetical protein
MGEALPQPDGWLERDRNRPLYESADFGDAMTPESAYMGSLVSRARFICA